MGRAEELKGVRGKGAAVSESELSVFLIYFVIWNG